MTESEASAQDEHARISGAPASRTRSDATYLLLIIESGYISTHSSSKWLVPILSQHLPCLLKLYWFVIHLSCLQLSLRRPWMRLFPRRNIPRLLSQKKNVRFTCSNSRNSCSDAQDSWLGWSCHHWSGEVWRSRREGKTRCSTLWCHQEHR